MRCSVCECILCMVYVYVFMYVCEYGICMSVWCCVLCVVCVDVVCSVYVCTRGVCVGVFVYGNGYHKCACP